jgi:hypothetical protein
MKACALLLAFAAACSAATPKVAAIPQDPAGCCCGYGDCRADLTQDACVSEAEFQGWTYTWHAGACTDQDSHPAPDRPASAR